MDDLRYSQAKRIFLEVCDLGSAAQSQRLDAIGKENPKLREEIESLLAYHEPEPDRERPTIGAPSKGASHAGEIADDARRDGGRGAEGGRGGGGRGSRTPGSGGPGSQFPEDGGRRSGEHAIGPYRVIRELGRGGMGVVYLAERQDDQFRRHVAIKLLKRGMDSDDVLRRFDLERQVLGALNHPGIARLYDGGQTVDGRPYFVMEHVLGVSITDYCDVHRLRIEERLELFRKVCAAVHHAHQNLVVHRDLKPSNIVVTEDGQPKLLDFGIAKIINPDMSLVGGDPTAPELRVMTPEYASPEQVRGMPISTASDVYSLGVLLYELLSGHAPYRLKSRVREELERIICDEDPERPSTAISRIEELEKRTGTGTGSSTSSITPASVGRLRDSRPDRLRRKLEGDIDNIVMKAMRKEPQRRYTSVQSFGDDIERHLKGMPVEARPDTVVYRFGKFVRRNKAGVAAAILVVLTLAGGVAGTTTGWRVAVQEKSEAQDARDDAQAAQERAEAAAAEAVNQRRRAEMAAARLGQVARVLLTEVHSAIKRLDSSLEPRRILIKTAQQCIDTLEADAPSGEVLDDLLALAHHKKADLYGGTRGQSIGDLAVAVEHSNRALEIRTRLVGEHPENATYRLQLAKSLQLRGDIAFHMSETADARKNYEQARDVLAELEATHADDLEVSRKALSAMMDLGKVLAREGDVRQARRTYGEVTKRRTAIVARTGNAEDRRELSVAQDRHAYQLAEAGHFDEALAEFGRSLDAREALRREGSGDDSTNRRDVEIAHLLIAQTQLQAERAEEALTHIRETLRLNQDGRGKSGDDARLRGGEIDARTLHGRILLAQGDLLESGRELEQALSLTQALAADEAKNAMNRRRLAEVLERLGEVAAAKGDLLAATDHATEAAAILESLRGEDPDDAWIWRQHARVQSKLSIWQVGSRNGLDAHQSLTSAIREYDELRNQMPDVVDLFAEQAVVLDAAATVALELGIIDKADEQARRSLELRRSLARIFESIGDRERAVAVLKEAREALDLPEVDLTDLREAVEEDLHRLGAE